MKFKTTQKAIKENFHKIIYVPYCNLQTLLEFDNPIAYTTRREGWGADIYDLGNGVALATGYAPFGNVKPSYELQRKYEEAARKIRYNYDIKWEQQREQIRELLASFVKEVR